MKRSKKLILSMILCAILFVVISILNTNMGVLADDKIFYGVKVDGIDVTDRNNADVLGNGNGEIVYTPSKGIDKPAVLTFNDDCEVAGITCTTNNIIITSGSEKAVTITLTKPILLGNNGENINVTIKGNSETNNLTIKPKQIGEVNDFRPIGIRSGNTLLMEKNAILQDSHATTFGGGMINVANGATFEMKGGIIQNSNVTTASYDNTGVYLGRGGAIYVAEGGTLKMSGGKIRNCSATVAGGAIYSNGTVEITGGQISECSVSGLADDKDASNTVKAKGGAVYLYKGNFSMKDGKIINNTLGKVDEMKGAGVYAASGVSITLGGTAKIKDNKNGENNNSNLFLYDNVEFNVDTNRKPEKDMEVYISTKTLPTENNSIKISTNGTENDKKYFKSDDDKYTVGYNENGFLELKLKKLYMVEFNSNGGSEIEAISVEEGNCISEPASPTKENMDFAGWYIDEALTEIFDFNTPINDNIKLYAKWVPASVHNEETDNIETNNVETNSENPKTEDTNIGIWIALMTTSIIGIIGTNKVLRKRK